MLLSKKNVSYSILAVIALLGLVLSLGLYRKAHEYEYQKIKAGFKNDCQNRFAVIQGHIDVHLERIDSLRDFFVGSVEVERDEFNMYVEDFLKKHPGIKSLMWIPEIKAEQRADFEKSVRQQGFEEFEISEIGVDGEFVRAGQREVYLPVYYVELFDENSFWLGLDMGSIPEINETLKLAVESTKLFASGRLKCLPEHISPFKVFAALAIYEKDADLSTVEQRRANLAGFIGAAVSVPAVHKIAGDLIGLQDIEVFIYDVTYPENEEFLFHYSPQKQNAFDEAAAFEMADFCEELCVKKNISFTQRQWQIRCQPGASYFEAGYSWMPSIMLSLGLLFTGLATLSLYKAIRGREHTEKIVKQRTSELRSSEERFRKYFELGLIGIAITSPEKGWIEVNDQICKILGYTKEELKSITWDKITYPQDLEPDVIQFNRILSGEIDAYSIEKRFVRKDGQIIDTQIAVRCLRKQDGAVDYLVVLLQDITERKIIEEQIKTLARFPSENPNPIMRISISGEIIYANDSSSPLLKLWETEKGKCIPDQWNKVVKDSISDKKVIHKECQCYNRVFSIAFAPVADSDYVNVYALDITELKRYESEREELLKTLEAKNEELESIVYTASHDLRSPLVNIQGFSGELTKTCEDLANKLDELGISKQKKEKLLSLLKTDINSSLGYITSSASKIDNLLSGLLRISRVGQASLEFKAVDVKTMVDRILKDMEHQIKQNGVEISVRDLPMCFADETQLSQVFTNLIDNSLKYLDSHRKGQIIICGKTEGDMVIYSVKDNGIGINPQYIDKIFEIFHQLEPGTVAGQGLGLTIVKRIIGRHNGRVWVESQEAKGSTFYVALPRA